MSSAQFERKRLRFSRIFCLGLQLIDESIPDELIEVLTDDLSEIAMVLSVTPAKLKTAIQHGDLREFLTRENKMMFLVECSTPVLQQAKGSSAYTYSWGHYASTWLYAETLDECVELALAWKAKREEQNALLRTSEQDA